MSRWSIVRSRFVDFLFRIEVVKRRGYRFIVLACSIGFRSVQRWQRVSFEICSRWPIDSRFGTTDRQAPATRHRVEQVRGSFHRSVRDGISGWIWESQRGESVEWSEGNRWPRRNLSQSIRDRIERGPSRFRCTPTGPKFSRRRDDGSTLSFTPGNLAPSLVLLTIIRSDELKNCFHSSIEKK